MDIQRDSKMRFLTKLMTLNVSMERGHIWTIDRFRHHACGLIASAKNATPATEAVIDMIASSDFNRESDS